MIPRRRDGLRTPFRGRLRIGLAARFARREAGEQRGDERADQRPGAPPPAASQEEHRGRQHSDPDEKMVPARGAPDAAPGRPVLALGRGAPIVVERAAGRVAEVPIEDLVHDAQLLVAGLGRIERRPQDLRGRRGRQLVPLQARGVGIVAAVELIQMGRPVARSTRCPLASSIQSKATVICMPSGLR